MPDVLFFENTLSNLLLGDNISKYFSYTIYCVGLDVSKYKHNHSILYQSNSTLISNLFILKH